MLDKLLKIIPKERVRLSEPMSKHTTFKIGGPADYFLTVNNLEELRSILKVAKEYNIALHIIGNGSNILVKDKGVSGIVVKLGMNDAKIVNINEGVVEAEAGISNAKFAAYLQENELSGFEFAAGIPGTIGGSICMNAGAFSGEFKDVIKDVTFIDMESLKLFTVPKSELNFGYRHSIFMDYKNAIILSARFEFKRGKKEDIKNRILEIFNERKSKQPIDKPSAGSTFRREKDFIPAKAIDESGLMGVRVGGAEVSTKHAGFIININHATAKDVLELINIIKKTIKEKYSVEIQPEIEIWE